MTKKEIVKQISDKLGLTQIKTRDLVQLTFDAIVATLVEEGRIELRDFGVFQVNRRKPRKARNPRTGDRVEVPSKNVVVFKPGKEMEEKSQKAVYVYALVKGKKKKVKTPIYEEGNGVEHFAAGKTRKSAGRLVKTP